MTEVLTVGGALVGFTRCIPTVNTYAENLPLGTASTVYPNYGLNTPDLPERVLNCRQELADELLAPIVWMQQTHSDEVAVVENYRYTAENSVTADAVIVPAGTVAAVQVADCVPVLLIDSKKYLAAAIHAGRAGIEKRILEKTVSKLLEMGSEPRNIQAVVGPCICENCYEVGVDVYQQYVELFPEGGATTSWGTLAIRLRHVVVQQLQILGINQIFHDLACTFEETELNSYRRQPSCGRQIGWVYFPTTIKV